MDLTFVSTIKALCQKYGIRPSRRLSQNFLVKRSVLQKLIKVADLKTDDVVLEIGPGFGVLTKELVKYVKKVVAVEKDKRMCEALRETLSEYKNAEIIEGDILKFLISNSQFLNKFQSPNFKFQKVVANLPYSITSRVLRQLLESRLFSELTLMVQCEVAERICAKPGNMSILSVMAQFYGEPKIVSFVPKHSFWPVSGVDSAILKIKTRSKEDILRITEKITPSLIGAVSPEFAREIQRPPAIACQWKLDEHRKRIESSTENGKITTSLWRAGKSDSFFKIVKIGFSSRRKQLKNNLVKGLKIEEARVKSALKQIGLKETARAEELSVKQWVRLITLISNELR